ncbi:hypothetical protein BGW38_003421 [Lunasporangiospora selenospora]|uniref:F-box domain-containing protein n=1 Tax=Lunasporangiospora selenospora TaxID=979761 RepID=A0A9P6G2W6_9FUNG|nr:hypothetical protein BGW38_003421 [Lunasporangiospora selenospora]
MTSPVPDTPSATCIRSTRSRPQCEDENNAHSSKRSKPTNAPWKGTRTSTTKDIEQGQPKDSCAPSQPQTLETVPPSQESVQQESALLDFSPEPGLLAYKPINPLSLHEIRINVGRFMDRRELWSCILVCEAWKESFEPFLWRNLKPVYKNVLGGTNDYPPVRLLKKNAHLIRSFEFNGHGTVLPGMINNPNITYSSSLDVVANWHPTPQDLIQEESWEYIDEDLSEEDVQLGYTSGSLIGRGIKRLRRDEELDDESLSDFEARILRKRKEREARATEIQAIRKANRRKNAVSKILNDTTDYRSRTCNKLERLILRDVRFSRDRGCYYKNWLQLMTENEATLNTFELHYGVRIFEAFQEIFNRIVSMTHLTELVLVENDIDSTKLTPFLRTLCLRLQRLELRNVRVDYGSPTGQLNESIPLMRKMKSLTLRNVLGRTTRFSLDFIKQCPNIVELGLSIQYVIQPTEISKILEEKVPHVTHLSFFTTSLSDYGVSQVIKSVPQIQKLDLSRTVFGLMATNNLITRHCYSISYLDVRGCSNLTGSMIQRILGECRNIRSFKADMVEAKNIVYNSVYPSWACLGIQELVLDIRGDPNSRETSWMVYRQLAQLTCLEYLDISRSKVRPPNLSNDTSLSSSLSGPYPNFFTSLSTNDSSNMTNNSSSNDNSASSNNTATTIQSKRWNVSATGEGYSNSLTLGLESGLKELRTLVNLRQITFRGIVHNDFGLVELNWMAKAWPRLEAIGGQLQEKRGAQYNPAIMYYTEENEGAVLGEGLSDLTEGTTPLIHGTEAWLFEGE